MSRHFYDACSQQLATNVMFYYMEKLVFIYGKIKFNFTEFYSKSKFVWLQKDTELLFWRFFIFIWFNTYGITKLCIIFFDKESIFASTFWSLDIKKTFRIFFPTIWEKFFIMIFLWLSWRNSILKILFLQFLMYNFKKMQLI